MIFAVPWSVLGTDKEYDSSLSAMSLVASSVILLIGRLVEPNIRFNAISEGACATLSFAPRPTTSRPSWSPFRYDMVRLMASTRS